MVKETDQEFFLFCISNGDIETADEWLTDIATAIWHEEPLSEDDRKAFVYALLSLIARGEASIFWNRGVKPNKKLKIDQDIETYFTVQEILANDGSLRLDNAQEIAARKLGYYNDRSSRKNDAEFKKVVNQYRRFQRKYNLFKKKLAAKNSGLQQPEFLPNPKPVKDPKP